MDTYQPRLSVREIRSRLDNTDPDTIVETAAAGTDGAFRLPVVGIEVTPHAVILYVGG